MTASLRHDPEYVPGPGMSFHRCRRCHDVDLGGWRSEECKGDPTGALDTDDFPEVVSQEGKNA